MPEKNPIESFDDAMREALQGAQTPVPPGVWEGVSGAVGAGAGATGTALGTAGKWLLAKWVGGIVGTALVASLIIQQVRPKEETSNTDHQVSEQIAKAPSSEAATDPDTESVGSAVENQERPASGSADPEAEPADATDTEAESLMSKQAAESPRAAAGSSEPVAQEPKGGSDGDTDEDQRTDVVKDHSPVQLNISNSSPCLHERVTIELVGEGVEAGSIRWMVDGKILQSASNTRLFEMRCGQVKQSRVQVQYTQFEKRNERSVLIAVKPGMRAEEALTTRESDGATSIIIKNNAVRPIAWLVDESFEAGAQRKLLVNCERSGVKRVALIAKVDGCVDTIRSDVHCTAQAGAEPLELNIPNVFSPYQQDGKNDEFVIQIPQVDQYHLQVLDARGNTVFETKDPNEFWNGRLMNLGDLQPAGWYHYFLFFQVDGKEQSKVGKVKLVE